MASLPTPSEAPRGADARPVADDRLARLAGSRLGAAHAAIARGLILAGAAISLVVSVLLWFTGDRESGIFVGLWVPSILGLGAFVVPFRGDR